MQSEFFTIACSHVLITWAFQRKMLLVLYMLLFQFETVLAEALRPLDALVSAHQIESSWITDIAHSKLLGTGLWLGARRRCLGECTLLELPVCSVSDTPPIHSEPLLPCVRKFGPSCTSLPSLPSQHTPERERAFVFVMQRNTKRDKRFRRAWPACLRGTRLRRTRLEIKNCWSE